MQHIYITHGVLVFPLNGESVSERACEFHILRYKIMEPLKGSNFKYSISKGKHTHIFEGRWTKYIHLVNLCFFCSLGHVRLNKSIDMNSEDDGNEDLYALL